MTLLTVNFQSTLEMESRVAVRFHNMLRSAEVAAAKIQSDVLPS
jgi:hypothetical protein